MMATMRDVAARAHVSVATVSHVLNGTRFVDPQTAERVRAAIEALSYRPNSLARSLRRSGTSTIGLLVPDNSNPFFAEIARAIEDVGFSAGYNVILCNSDRSEAKEAAYVETLLSKQVDGLILSSSGSSFAPLQMILDSGVPCVVVDRELSELVVDQVVIDNEQGGYLAAKHLVELGHRCIGYIAGPNPLALSAHRLTGFRRALTEVGLELPDKFIVQGDFQYAGGIAAMQELLARNLDLTAIFATNDPMAIGAISVLGRTGLRVPDDLSVIGFDNISQATAIYPALTTVAQPMIEMAQVGVSRLLERIKNRDSYPPQRIVLPTRLIERESCRAISNSPVKNKVGKTDFNLYQ